MRILRRAVCFALLLAMFAGCGFALRGSVKLPFNTFYISIGDTSPIAVVLKRSIRGNGPTRLVTRPSDAEGRLDILGETLQTTVLTVNRLGEATEYNLYYHIRFRVSNGRGDVNYIPPTEFVIKRLILVNNNATLAQNNEINELYEDMRSDAAQQILRRIEAIKLPPPKGDRAPGDETESFDGSPPVKIDSGETTPAPAEKPSQAPRDGSAPAPSASDN